MSLFIGFLLPIFLVAIYVFFKFSWSKESKDESGKQIVMKAAENAIPIFPTGWLLMEYYHRYIQEISLQLYRDYMGILFCITFIVIGFSIVVLKQKRKQNNSTG
ncbi:hypothetical protein [Virgibacillus salexigens]|uniref:Uncharacterized protein n=1 Tax=Virgibacillus massiliensis TaxID=1462526 RepID=A0A024QEF9_9BACI|nr:hypothetical protein [Virgibacillus massiliensis]MYL42976.1 hypothetical protein [Virgibacillus massiliensis]CDQ40884.1 hypothetical protein BN990_03217 [Virgibacillus massiliensis]